MKKTVCAMALCLAVLAPTANAAGYVQPHVPVSVVVDDTAASNRGIFVPIFGLLMVILVHHG